MCSSDARRTRMHLRSRLLFARDPRLFYSFRWIDEAAFDSHGGMQHTGGVPCRRLERVLDPPMECAAGNALGELKDGARQRSSHERIISTEKLGLIRREWRPKLIASANGAGE